MNKSENRVYLPSKLEDLLSKTPSLAPKKGLASDKEGNQIKIRIALSDRSRAAKSTLHSRELSDGFYYKYNPSLFSLRRIQYFRF